MVDALLEEPFIMTIYGPRKTGKSYFVNHILEEKLAKHFDEIHVLSASLRYNHDYDKFRKRSYKYKKKFYWYDDPETQNLETIFKDQSVAQENFINYERGDDLVNLIKKFNDHPIPKQDNKNKKKRKLEIVDNEFIPDIKTKFQREPHGFYIKDIGIAPESNRVKPPRSTKVKQILIILDDVVDTGVLSRLSSIDKYAMRGRHINVSVIIACQRISPTSINVRDNADIMICFRPYSVQEFERLVDTFIPTNNKKWAKQMIMDVYEVDHDFVIIDNMNKKPYEKIGRSNCDRYLLNDVEPINVLDNSKLQNQEYILDEDAPKEKTKKRKR